MAGIAGVKWEAHASVICTSCVSAYRLDLDGKGLLRVSGWVYRQDRSQPSTRNFKKPYLESPLYFLFLVNQFYG